MQPSQLGWSQKVRAYTGHWDRSCESHLSVTGSEILDLASEIDMNARNDILKHSATLIKIIVENGYIT